MSSLIYLFVCSLSIYFILFFIKFYFFYSYFYHFSPFFIFYFFVNFLYSLILHYLWINHLNWIFSHSFFFIHLLYHLLFFDFKFHLYLLQKVNFSLNLIHLYFLLNCFNKSYSQYHHNFNQIQVIFFEVI